MKKLIMAVAIVCVAVASQAASISWGNSTTIPIYGLDGTTKISSALATTYALSVALVDADGTPVQTATVTGMSAGVLSGAAYTYTYDTDYSAGDTFTILAKMTVDGKNYEMEIGNYTITSASDNTGKDTFTWASGTYGGLSGTATAGTAGSWVAQSVPEPTSGLLLVLGMAGLALRRRRA